MAHWLVILPSMALIVHLAGLMVDHEELEPTHRHEAIPFDPFALTTTQFLTAILPGLLTETHTHLKYMLVLINPTAIAA